MTAVRDAHMDFFSLLADAQIDIPLINGRAAMTYSILHKRLEKQRGELAGGQVIGRVMVTWMSSSKRAWARVR